MGVGPGPRASRLLLRGRLLAQTRLVLADLGRGRLAEVLDLEHLPDLDLAIVEGDALDPLDRLLLRLDLDQPEPGDQLLRLGEGPVDDGPGVPVEPHARAPRAGVEPLAREQDAGLDQFLVVAAHRLELFGGRQDAGLGRLGRLDQDHEAHGWTLPMVAFWGCPAGLPCGPWDRRLPSERRTRCCRIDTPRPVRVTAIVAHQSDERGAAGSTRGRTEVGRWPQRRSGTAPPVWGRGRWPPRAALTARRRPPQQDERAAGIARRPSCVARPALLAVRTT